MKEVHGHELINLILKENTPKSIKQIQELAIAKIGENVVYYTCSESSMNTIEMINFLLERNKLIKKGTGYIINTGEVCEHG